MDPLFSPSDADGLVTLGVDTHADVHDVGVALDRLGRRLGSKSVPATEAGYAELVAWVEGFGVLGRVGVEGRAAASASGARAFLADQQGSGGRRGKSTQPPAQAQVR